MSASATTRDRPRSRSYPIEPTRARVFFFGFALLVLVALLAQLPSALKDSDVEVSTLLVWVAVAAIGDLMAVQVWDDLWLSMSLPVTLAAAMVLVPPLAGLVAFVAAVDPREFRREISLAHDLFNRGQVALSVLLASITFHALGGDLDDWPKVLVIALAALAVDWAVNIVSAATGIVLLKRHPVSSILERLHGEAALEAVIGYVCLGLLAVLLATVYQVAHGWGLVTALIPLTLARQMFMRGRRLEEAARHLESKDRALLSTAEQALQERRDERLAVAGELHDEVLPPLFNVHLMGQVLKQDLNLGRLLDLDEDLPQLLDATEAAQSAIRGLVRGLRQSSLGPGGLNGTIELLARQLESAGSPPIHLDLQDVGGSKVSQLLAYQVVREALNNAARHSRASSILVRLHRDEGLIRLLVADDGIGFDPLRVDRESHFGLQLIAERVEAGRGRVVVDSTLGDGTRVMATLPPEILGGDEVAESPA